MTGTIAAQSSHRPLELRVMDATVLPVTRPDEPYLYL